MSRATEDETSAVQAPMTRLQPGSLAVKYAFKQYCRINVKMSEEITLTLPNSTLEDLRCFMCKGYLSCSPVRLLPKGNCICGRCTPLNEDTPVHRLVAFELILSRMSFPCVFKKYGCLEMLLFGKTVDHEPKCIHRTFACPTKASTMCSWEGNASQLLDHFKHEHPDLLKDEAKFKLELDKDAQGILMVIENSFAFIVKYFYEFHEKILKYDVRLCDNKSGLKAFSKMRLINDTDTDCKLYLKMIECFSYDESFYDTQNAKVLKINKILESLSDPTSIVVALKLNVNKSNSANVTTESHCKVNFDRNKTLRCFKCQNYSVPAFFVLNDKYICFDCVGIPASDTDILKLLNEAMYECSWRECKFVGKSNIFKNHVMNCKFRQYRCVYSHCNTTFKLSAAADHLRTHEATNIVYMPDIITYKMSFARHSPPQDILTIKNNRIIVIQHRLTKYPLHIIHFVGLCKSPDDLRDISGIINFEHEHCLLKSKELNISSKNELEVTLKELPPHFKVTDELTVTVELIA